MTNRANPNTRPFSLLLCLGLALSIGSQGACTHTPDPQKSKQAQAKYRVGVVLVHEAQEASSQNNPQKQRLKYRDALEELLAAKEINPKDPEILYLLGFVYFTGFARHTEAESELRAALAQSEKEYPEAQNLLGQVLTDAGRPKEALEFFEKARTNLLYKTPYFAEQEMGWAKYKLGDYQGASRHLEGALAMQPDLCGAYLKLAEVYSTDDKGPKVIASLERFMHQCDTDRLRKSVSDSLLAHAFYRMGMARLKSAESTQAAGAFRTCIERFPTQTIALECKKSLALLE